MSSFQNSVPTLGKFTGQVRVFPLPNLVMFPHILQPLRAFEPRYRELIADAMQGDRLIAMATLAPGWEHDYDGRPALYRFGCLGQIVSCHQLPDGTYNLLLAGLQRIKFREELSTGRSYREARVELCRDVLPNVDSAAIKEMRGELNRMFRNLLPALADAQEQVQHLVEADLPLGMLADLIGYTLDVDLRRKMALLEELNVDRRAQLVLDCLEAAAEDDLLLPSGQQDFPPPFSLN